MTLDRSVHCRVLVCGGNALILVAELLVLRSFVRCGSRTRLVGCAALPLKLAKLWSGYLTYYRCANQLDESYSGSTKQQKAA